MLMTSGAQYNEGEQITGKTPSQIFDHYDKNQQKINGYSH